MIPKPININEMIERFKKFLSRLISENIEIITNLNDKDIISMADTGQIEQVLLNLATNARDAMPNGGRLILETQLVELDDTFVRTYGYGEPGTFAVISVSDTGVGMDEETVAQILSLFHYQGGRKGHWTGSCNGIWHSQATQRLYQCLQ